MSVIRLYPHRLQYLVSKDGYEDSNGDYHEGETNWEGCIECDAVPAGKASEKEFDDGIVRSYSYTVYLRANCRTFMIGDRIKIHLLEGVEREFSVKGFHRYQKQCKLWV